jgi:hypothetical protein
LGREYSYEVCNRSPSRPQRRTLGVALHRHLPQWRCGLKRKAALVCRLMLIRGRGPWRRAKREREGPDFRRDDIPCHRGPDFRRDDNLLPTSRTCYRPPACTLPVVVR